MSKAATLAGFATSIIPPNDLIVGIVTATSLSVGNQTVSSLGVGISTEGGSVGTGATVLDFRGAGISTVTVSSGIATVNITGGGGGGGASVTTSDTAPVSPSDGDLWYDSVGGRMYVYYDDGDTSQWVDAAPQGGGNAFSAKIEVGNTKAEVIDTGSDGRFVVTTEGTERLRVNSAGKVVLSGSTPLGLFNLVGVERPSGPSSYTSAEANAKAQAGLNWYQDNNANYEYYLDLFATATSESPWGGSNIRLFTTAKGTATATERMRITPAGHFGFYGTDPATEVRGLTSGYGLRLLNNSYQESAFGNSGYWLFNNTTSSGTRYFMFFRVQGVDKGSISSDGNSIAYNTTSDYRLKENVVPLTGAADRLKQIPVHRFNFIANPDRTVDGFLAHEAQSIVPECVTGTKDEVDDEGNPVYQGIDQSKLVPLLTAALQEALTKIETLETQNASLEARLTALEGGN